MGNKVPFFTTYNFIFCYIIDEKLIISGINGNLRGIKGNEKKVKKI
ncbi:hypothetical protein [Butyrivibrio proteoclasticus]|nr:hypothetical protein [Butyrivibrio proteoclasticus]